MPYKGRLGREVGRRVPRRVSLFSEIASANRFTSGSCCSSTFWAVPLTGRWKVGTRGLFDTSIARQLKPTIQDWLEEAMASTLVADLQDSLRLCSHPNAGP